MSTADEEKARMAFGRLVGCGFVLEMGVKEYNSDHDWETLRMLAECSLEPGSPACEQLKALNPFSKTPIWEACANNYVELLAVLIDAGLDTAALSKREQLMVQRSATMWGIRHVDTLYCRRLASSTNRMTRASMCVSAVRSLQRSYNSLLSQLGDNSMHASLR